MKPAAPPVPPLRRISDPRAAAPDRRAVPIPSGRVPPLVRATATPRSWVAVCRGWYHLSGGERLLEAHARDIHDAALAKIAAALGPGWDRRNL